MLNPIQKNNEACTYQKLSIQNHPSPTPGGRINSGRGMRGTSACDRTNMQPITHSSRSAHDNKTYRTANGGAPL